MSGPVHRSADVAEVRHESSAVVINLARLEVQQVPLVFEGSSFAIWSRIDGTRTEEALVADVAAEYGMEAVRLAPDVRAFIHRIAELGLVVGGA